MSLPIRRIAASAHSDALQRVLVVLATAAMVLVAGVFGLFAAVTVLGLATILRPSAHPRDKGELQLTPMD